MLKNQTGWAELLYRFVKGGGSIFDIEFMTDDNGEIYMLHRQHIYIAVSATTIPQKIAEIILTFLFSLLPVGKCVVPVFSTMAGLCGMAVGVIAWCHQQLK